MHCEGEPLCIPPLRKEDVRRSVKNKEVVEKWGRNARLRAND